MNLRTGNPLSQLLVIIITDTTFKDSTLHTAELGSVLIHENRNTCTSSGRIRPDDQETRRREESFPIGNRNDQRLPSRQRCRG